MIAVDREPVLDDGRIVRLAGLTPLRSNAALSLGPAKVSVIARTPDRWGRVPGYITSGRFADSINLRLLREGAALAVPGEWPSGCFQAARDAENEARRAQRGLWARPLVIAADDLERLHEQVGRFTIIEGQVRSVRQGRRQIFLNFGTFGRDRLSVTVALSRLPAFKEAGLDPLALRGQFVSLRGVVGPGSSMELNMPEAVFVVPRP